MRIVFFSNFLNHHQIPFCVEMIKYLGENFTFVSTEQIPQEMLLNGYQDFSREVYNLLSYANPQNYEKAMQLGMDSDIVIIGSAPEIFVQERLRQNKHTFRYSERLFKLGIKQRLSPYLWLKLFDKHTLYRRKNLYMLCASAYTANDLDSVFAYPNKKFKWGYFPHIEELAIEQVIAEKPSDPLEIIWVGRFLDWKHPDLAVRLAYELKKKNHRFHLNMIGSGDMLVPVQNLIKKLDVGKYVSLLGGIPNSEVITRMRKSNIFLFTSDRQEGWGAVLNEAMSSSCAVVASHMIGAVPYLIQHRKNGLIFKCGSLADLLRQTENLILDKSFREELSRQAYLTLKNQWSPQVAAANFMQLVQAVLDGRNNPIKSGPCSNAESTPTGYWLR